MLTNPCLIQVHQIKKYSIYTLHRLTSEELLPPPSTDLIPLDYTPDPDDYEYVQDRSIEFLVMDRKTHDLSSGLFFLERKQLQELFDFVCTQN